mmetsp:Transcript_44135/g.101922  ORF Transcript_44135/g.101922 Transcript_44135/m.101922 type:complete len:215 (+) Transcript_44135:253-897(+)
MLPGVDAVLIDMPTCPTFASLAARAACSAAISAAASTSIPPSPSMPAIMGSSSGIASQPDRFRRLGSCGSPSLDRPAFGDLVLDLLLDGEDAPLVPLSSVGGSGGGGASFGGAGPSSSPLGSSERLRLLSAVVLDDELGLTCSSAYLLRGSPLGAAAGTGLRLSSGGARSLDLLLSRCLLRDLRRLRLSRRTCTCEGCHERLRLVARAGLCQDS